MSHKTAATIAHTIGIDTGKNTLHLVGLDDKGQSFCGKRSLATGSQSGSPVCHKNDFRDAHAIAEAVGGRSEAPDVSQCRAPKGNCGSD